MDPTFALLLGTDLAFAALITVGYLIAKRKIAKARAEVDQKIVEIEQKVTAMATNAMGSLVQKLVQWAFVPGETEIADPDHPGQKRTVKTLTSSEPFRQVVAMLIPELIGQAMLWFKNNKGKVSLADVAGAVPGGDLAAMVDTKLLKQMGIPKEVRGYIQLGLQFKDQILGFLGKFSGGKFGGGAAAPGSTEAPKYANPFLKT